MNKVFGILYASRESQTRHIAEHISQTLRERSLEADVIDVREPEKIDLERYSAVILAASVHAGKHESEMLTFIKAHRSRLLEIPSVFLSVSLSEAGVERSGPETEEHRRFVADVRKLEDALISNTGWPPERFKAVAGALPYSKYNWFVRFVMKRIAQKSGGDTDTSHDYEYTDWVALEKFVTEFADNAVLCEPDRAI
ncbi:MAG: flavodoxin domain-containing protein [Bryobacteraceae bacterium]